MTLLGEPTHKIDKIWAPAGLDLGAATAEEIALSIMSQIVALRRGHSALLSLKDSGAGREQGSAERVIHQCELDRD